MIEHNDTATPNFAEMAIKLKQILKTDLSIDLEYDEKAIEYLDGYIERIKPNFKNNQGIITAIGAFLGETLIFNYGGKWKLGDNGQWGIIFKNNSWAFPFNKVAKRFAADGEYDSIAGFYKITKLLIEGKLSK